MADATLAKKGKGWQAFDGLPNVDKTIIIGFGVLLVAFTGYTVYEYIKNQKALALQTGTQNVVTGNLAALKNGGMTQSYDDSQYPDWAIQIQTALNGCTYSSDIATVQAIFAKLQNLVDLLLLQQAFSLQQRTPCWYSHPWNDMFDSATSETGNLSFWLQQTFSTSDFAQLNAQLASAGINFTFQ